MLREHIKKSSDLNNVLLKLKIKSKFPNILANWIQHCLKNGDSDQDMKQKILQCLNHWNNVHQSCGVECNG